MRKTTVKPATPATPATPAPAILTDQQIESAIEERVAAAIAANSAAIERQRLADIATAKTSKGTKGERIATLTALGASASDISEVSAKSLHSFNASVRVFLQSVERVEDFPSFSDTPAVKKAELATFLNDNGSTPANTAKAVQHAKQWTETIDSCKVAYRLGREHVSK